MISEKNIVLNLAIISNNAGLDWKPYWDHLNNTFPLGAAKLVTFEDGEIWIATTANDLWNEAADYAGQFRFVELAA